MSLPEISARVLPFTLLLAAGCSEGEGTPPGPASGGAVDGGAAAEGGDAGEEEGGGGEAGSAGAAPVCAWDVAGWRSIPCRRPAARAS